MSENKPTFWSLLKESIIVQSCITLAVIGVDLYLYIVRGSLPQGLDSLTYIVVSFWMGTKAQHAVEGAVSRAASHKE